MQIAITEVVFFPSLLNMWWQNVNAGGSREDTEIQADVSLWKDNGPDPQRIAAETGGPGVTCTDDSTDTRHCPLRRSGSEQPGQALQWGHIGGWGCRAETLHNSSPHHCLPQICEDCVSIPFGKVAKDHHRDDRGSPPSLRPDGREVDGLKLQEEGCPLPDAGLPAC